MTGRHEDTKPQSKIASTEGPAQQGREWITGSVADPRLGDDPGRHQGHRPQTDPPGGQGQGQTAGRIGTDQVHAGMVTGRYCGSVR